MPSLPCSPALPLLNNTPLLPPPPRHLPVNKAAWQDVKGAMVLAGTYEEAVKMMGDMNFLQARLLRGEAACMLMGYWPWCHAAGACQRPARCCRARC